MSNNSFSLWKGKKGFEMQFNWLFVLIAGVIFLAFFFSLIKGHSSDSVKEDDIGAQQDLDSLLRSSQSSAELQKIVAFGKQLRFSCYDSGSDGSGSYSSSVSEYYVGNSDSAVQYNYKVIFSPRVLDGKELVIKSSAFRMPFNIMPFVFVMNKNIEFVFVGNNSVVNQLYSSLPINATKKKISLAGFVDFPNNNYYNTVFVMNSTDGAIARGRSLSNFKQPSDHKKVFAVVIDAAGGLAESYGTVNFYDYASSGFALDKISSFVGYDLLLGAIVSHDSVLYECQLRKAMLRANLSISLHKLKLDAYIKSFSDECSQNYVQISGLLGQSQALLSEKNIDFEKLFPLLWSVDRLNTILVQRTECPPLY